jgi:nucleoid-associated protein YgaU
MNGQRKTGSIGLIGMLARCSGAALILWLALAAGRDALPLPTRDVGAWFDSVGPDGVVMSLLRVVVALISAHACLVHGLCLAARVLDGRSLRPSPSTSPRSGLAVALHHAAIRLAGPLWRKTITTALGLSLTVPGVASASPRPGSIDGHGGPQRWPQLEASSSAPTSASIGEPMLVRVGDRRPQLVRVDQPVPSSTVAIPSTAPNTTAPNTTAPNTTAPGISNTAPTTQPVASTSARGSLTDSSIAHDVAAGMGLHGSGSLHTGGGASTTWIVRPGDHFWSIAQSTISAQTTGGPDDEAVGRYWLRLVEANRDRLPVPGNPDLLYPGTVLELPSV